MIKKQPSHMLGCFCIQKRLPGNLCLLAVAIQVDEVAHQIDSHDLQLFVMYYKTMALS